MCTHCICTGMRLPSRRGSSCFGATQTIHWSVSDARSHHVTACIIPLAWCLQNSAHHDAEVVARGRGLDGLSSESVCCCSLLCGPSVRQPNCLIPLLCIGHMNGNRWDGTPDYIPKMHECRRQGVNLASANGICVKTFAPACLSRFIYSRGTVARCTGDCLFWIC